MAQGAEEDRQSTIDCTITTSHPIWRPDEEATVSVEIRFQGVGDITVSPSINLVAVPKTAGPLQEQYWAPFDIPTGSSTQKRQISTVNCCARFLMSRSVRLRYSRTDPVTNDASVRFLQ